jgi:hypothetical protein
MLAAVACGTLAIAGTATAQVGFVQRSAVVNAAGACQGALPSYEGSLRKRPTGIANEGSAPAFVSCSLTGEDFALGTITVLSTFVNRSGADVDLTCTFVDGNVAELEVYPAAYYPQTITIGAGEGGQMVWEATDEAFTSLSNVSCSLPAGVEINVMGTYYVVQDETQG